MNRKYLVTMAFFSIAACATSVPEAPEPSAEVGKPVTNSNSTAGDERLEVAEIPKVPISAPVSAPEVRCRSETEIGSRRVKRICRTQSEIDETQTAAQDSLNDLQEMQDIENTLIGY